MFKCYNKTQGRRKEIAMKVNRSKKAAGQLERDSTDREKQSKSSDCGNREANQVVPTEPLEVLEDGTKLL